MHARVPCRTLGKKVYVNKDKMAILRCCNLAPDYEALLTTNHLETNVHAVREAQTASACGCVWFCMVLCGCVWFCVIVWFCMVLCGIVRLYVVVCGCNSMCICVCVCLRV